jgi:hypothetical protein
MKFLHKKFSNYLIHEPFMNSCAIVKDSLNSFVIVLDLIKKYGLIKRIPGGYTEMLEFDKTENDHLVEEIEKYFKESD